MVANVSSQDEMTVEISDETSDEATDEATDETTVKATECDFKNTKIGMLYCPEACIKYLGMPNGSLQLTVYEDCKKYYKCYGDYAIVEVCPPGLYFDESAQACDWKDFSNCCDVSQNC